MADPVLTPRQLRSARERLIDRGVTDASVPPSSIGVRPAIERSWRRAVAQHIAADAAAARFVNAINTDDPLLRAAAPVVEHWQDCLSGMHVATFLSDRNGQIVARRVSDRGDMRRLDQVFAAEGFDFSESSLGTNGLGTAIEDRIPVFVRGGEHFSESLESLACAGAPIRDLGTGQVLGSLAFATVADAASPLMLAMARQAVAQIEQRFAQAAAPPGLAAAITAIAGGRLASRPVLVLSEQAVIANTLALGFVSAELHAALWETLRSVDWTGVSAEVVRLPGSMGEAAARRLGTAGGGAVYIVRLRGQPRSVAGPKPGRQARRGRPRPAAEPALGRGQDPAEPGGGPGAGHQPGAVTAAGAQAVPGPADLESIARATGAVTLVGPAGSGKCHVARCWLSGRCGGQQPLTLDAAEVLDDDHAGWRRAAASALGSGRSVILRHVEALDPLELSQLDAMARRLCVTGTGRDASAPRLALTVNDALAAPGVIARLARFATVVNVPALRDTRERIPGLVAELLAAQPLESRVTLSSAAVQAFLRWDWPVNVAELRLLLDMLAATHAGGIVRLDDLPARLRTRVRALSGIELAECDAIVAALRRANGNRAAAARDLGIGRTTLYRKLRAYRIDTGSLTGCRDAAAPATS